MTHHNTCQLRIYRHTSDARMAVISAGAADERKKCKLTKLFNKTEVYLDKSSEGFPLSSAV